MSHGRLLESFASGSEPPALAGGVGGRLRERPEDFLVEEIPLHQPSGEGEHLYLLVEKRNLSTMEMAQAIARHFGVRRRDIGFAGLKDKKAITRQVISVWAPSKEADRFPMLRHDRLVILWSDRHTHKLRRGQLAGNRFSIRVRGVDIHAVVSAQRTMERLARDGLPNRIGEQRFGFLGNNHLVGRAVLLGRWGEAVELLLGPNEEHPDAQPQGRELFAKGRYGQAIGAYHRSLRTERNLLKAMSNGASPEQAVRSMEQTALSFFVSAFQSAVFNAVLTEREEAGTVSSLIDGDVAFEHATREMFPVGAAEVSNGRTRDRVRRLEISPSGPMWGAAMRRAAGAVDAAEVSALHATGVREEDLERYAKSGGPIDGERRPLRVPVLFPEVEGGADEHGGYVRCAFELPRGCFATSVMREVMGCDPDGPSGRSGSGSGGASGDEG